MEIIKHNQCLKIDLSYDHDNGYYFEDFIEVYGIERISIGNSRGYSYLKIGEPDARHYLASYLLRDSHVREELELHRDYIDADNMPALTANEAERLSEQVADEDWGSVDFDLARRGLLSMTHQVWYDSLYDDCIEAELRPYRYTARGYSQGDVAHLYLIGMEEAEALAKDFELYAYGTPCRFNVELIDCETGEPIANDGLCGIYDTTSDLVHLKAELLSAITNLDGIDDEVKSLALEAVQDLDPGTIKF